jgi:hypothetical protein
MYYITGFKNIMFLYHISRIVIWLVEATLHREVQLVTFTAEVSRRDFI